MEHGCRRLLLGTLGKIGDVSVFHGRYCFRPRGEPDCVWVRASSVSRASAPDPRPDQCDLTAQAIAKATDAAKPALGSGRPGQGLDDPEERKSRCVGWCIEPNATSYMPRFCVLGGGQIEIVSIFETWFAPSANLHELEEEVGQRTFMRHNLNPEGVSPQREFAARGSVRPSRRLGGRFVRNGERAAFGPPVCVERRNNATLALARLILAPQP